MSGATLDGEPVPLDAGRGRARREFDEDDDPSRGLRAALSFVAAFAGWVAGLAWQVAASALASPPRRGDDFEAIAYWSAAFVFAVWLAAMLPLAIRVSMTTRWLRLPLSPILGAACGWAGLCLLLLPFGGSELGVRWPFAIHAALTGACAWSTFALLVRARAFRRRASSAIAASLLAPPLATAAFLVIVWPALERFAPFVAYRIGSGSARSRIFERTIRELRVGETLTDLQRRLPGEFSRPTTGSGGQLGSGTSYWIRFEEGVITSVEIGEGR